MKINFPSPYCTHILLKDKISDVHGKRVRESFTVHGVDLNILFIIHPYIRQRVYGEDTVMRLLAIVMMIYNIYHYIYFY